MHPKNPDHHHIIGMTSLSLSTSSLLSVEEIHPVGTINNVETSYFTQLKMCYLMTTFRCPSGHLDHVLIVYSSREHVTWKLPGPAVNNQDVIKMSDGHRNVVIKYHNSVV